MNKINTEEDVNFTFLDMQNNGTLHHSAKIENFKKYINNKENATCYICENTSYGEFFCCNCLEHIKEEEKFYEEEELSEKRAYSLYEEILKSRKRYRTEKCYSLIALDNYLKNNFFISYLNPINDIKIKLQPKFNERFADSIEIFRKKNNSKYQNVLELLTIVLKIDQSKIHKLLTGNIKPTAHQIFIISKTLGVSMDYLCGLSKNHNRTENYTNEEIKLIECYRLLHRSDKNQIQEYFLKLSDNYTNKQ